MQILKKDLDQMPQRYRANFVNSLSGFKSANLIGSINSKNQTNLCIVSSVFHLGASPALIGFINRPHSVERHTLENIHEIGFYTINHVNKSIIKQAHQTSARYPREISEYEATNLEEEFSEMHPAPYVKESHLKIGVQLKEAQTLNINKTILVIGEIVEVLLPEGVLKESGYLDVESLGSVAISGLDCYHTTKKEHQLSYAKPDAPIKEI